MVTEFCVQVGQFLGHRADIPAGGIEVENQCRSYQFTTLLADGG